MLRRPRSYVRKSIRPEMTVRQIAADFPPAQDVFRRYGECDRSRARFGHLEPLTHFARRQGVSIENLLAELVAATDASVDVANRCAERIHHGFVLSALAVTLTLGAGWGAWLLWQIGMNRDFRSVPPAHVIGHGEAQLWGFIVLFIMGVSLRTVLQPVVRCRWGTQTSCGLLALALFGIVGGYAWSLWPEAFALPGVVGAASLLLMAAGYSVLQVSVLYSKWPATWARAVMTAGFWLIVWAVVTVYFRTLAGVAGPGVYSDSQRLLLIELAVFGFAMNSIYGFGQMLLPGLLRIGSTKNWAIECSHWLHNLGTIVLCLATGPEWPRGTAAVGCAFVAIGAIFFAIGIRGFVGRRRALRRAEKGFAPLDLYPPLAFFWLVVSLMLMTGGLMYETSVQQPLPHAYMGAVRHALTVGFMTTLILGVGQRLLPVLDHTVLALPRLAVPILILIGTGNFLRVGSEMAIVATPAAFPVMPFSALLEWFALLLFFISCVSTMYHADPLLKRGSVTKRSSLAVLLAEYPWIEDRLVSYGSEYVERARSVPQELTIETFAKIEGYDAIRFVAEVNTWLSEGNADLSQLNCT